MLIKNNQDFWSGLMFIVIGAGFALFSTSYDMGTPARMGPGYFPFWLGVVLALLGGVVTINSLRGKEGEDHHVGKFDFDILALIIGSIVVFGVMLDNLGLYISLVILVIFSSLASHEFSLKIAIGNAIFLVIFTWLAFVRGLGLIFPLWPVPIAEWPTYAMIIIPVSIIIGVIILISKLKGSK